MRLIDGNKVGWFKSKGDSGRRDASARHQTPGSFMCEMIKCEARRHVTTQEWKQNDITMTIKWENTRWHETIWDGTEDGLD